MNRAFTILAFSFFFHYSLSGQIFCPSDVTTSCFSDLGIAECGNATIVSANYHPSQIKFEDDNQTNSCNEGQVFRRFYLDINYDNAYNDGEPFCIQTITLEYNELPLNISFPNDIELTCADDIPVQSPTWASHPCDLIGYTYEDEVFEFEAGACLKIVRHYTVINWCRYENGGANGLSEGMQIIKIIDEQAPEIEGCVDVEFDAIANCEAQISLSNSAADAGDCPSGMVTWRVTIDLWGDGTDDLFYGPNQPQPFRLDPVPNGSEVTVNLPEAIGISSHKVLWKATDGCGNVRSCSTAFTVADNKAPTPYCYGFLSATLNATDGHDLVVPATLFDVDGQDNCSSKDEIRLSFSENVDDTERVVNCDGSGFQFYRIYYTDAAGNQDFCEAFLFVIDNGSCSNKFVPAGRVVDPHGNPLTGATASLMSGPHLIASSQNDEVGAFTLGEQSIMESYAVSVEKPADATSIDILDYKTMLDAALGKIELDLYQRISADINSDGSVTIADLKAMREGMTDEADYGLGEYLFVSAADNEVDEMSSSITISEYTGSFDFVGVQRGDLVTSIDDLSAEEEETVKLRLVVNDGTFNIETVSEMHLPLFQIEFTEDQAISDIVSEIGLDIYAKGNRSEVGNMTSDRSIQMPAGSNLFSAKWDRLLTSGNDNLITSFIDNVSWISQSGKALAVVQWEVVDQRLEKKGLPLVSAAVGMRLSHTVVDDSFTIFGSEGRAITITDVRGNHISFQHNYSTTGEAVISGIANLPSGLYFVTVGEGADITSFRFVKA